MDNLVESYNNYLDTYPKSNALIMSKYRSSMLANKIHAINIACAENMQVDPDSGALVQDLPVSYYMEKLGVNSTSIYQNLKQAAKSMTSHSIGFSDPDEKKFMYLAFVIRAECSGGRFRTYYNPYLTKYLSNLQKDFTILNLSITLAFKKSLYSQRLYEIVRKFCFFRSNEKPSPLKVFSTRIDIDELKLLMGTVNAENDKVKRILDNNANPDYHKAVAAATGKDKVLDDWKSFRKRALDPATAEINDVSDINLSYEPVRQGRGGKIRAIIFSMSFKQDFFEAKYGEIRNDDEVSKEKKEEIEEWFCDMMPVMLHIRDVRSICAEANYDMDVLKKACAYMNSYNKDISNVAGFMLDAIRHNCYENNNVKKEHSGKTAKSKKSESGRNYDYDEIEKQFEQMLLFRDEVKLKVEE